MYRKIGALITVIALLLTFAGVEAETLYQKEGQVNTDAYGLATILTDARPDKMEIFISDMNGGEVSATLDFSNSRSRDGESWNGIPLDDGTIGIVAERMDYGVAFELYYTEDGWDWEALDNCTVRYKIRSSRAPYEGPAHPDETFYHVKGREVIDGNGNPIQLKSIGMSANDFNSTDSSQRKEPMTWAIGDAAFEEVASLGFNSVRLAIGYQLLEDDKHPYRYREEGWQWLDQIVEWAENNHVGIILNLHSSQGGKQYSAAGAELWLESENQDRIAAMWQAIAERYAQNKTFIGWDLMNETHLLLWGSGLARGNKTYSDFLQNVIDSIREVDPNHMIIVDRAQWLYQQDWNEIGLDSQLYYPLVRDDNLLLELHDYRLTPTRNEDGTVTPGGSREEMAEELEKNIDCFRYVYGDDIPIFVGEYGCKWNYDSSDKLFLRWVSDMTAVMDEAGYSRNIHMYYCHNDGSGDKMGMRYVNSPHGYFEDGTLYEPLAEIFRSAQTNGAE